MGRRRPWALVSAVVVTVVALSAGCGVESSPTTEPPTDMVSETTTTTTIGVGGATTEVPPTAPEIEMLEDVPETFLVLFDERYVCQLGFAGESEITASGSVEAEMYRGPDGSEVTGSGSMDVTGLVRAGDVCSGDAAGTHRMTVSGMVENDGKGTPTLRLLVTGVWYETWDGEIECQGGLPPSGPWDWPPEQNAETLTFSPFEDGATWVNEVTMGLCQGTVTRVIDFPGLPSAPTSEP